MNQTEHVLIPSEFFAKTLKEYQNWRFAWFRETAQNAADAGATRIDFVVEQLDTELVLSVADNGTGMDEPTLRQGLLILGGSVKPDEPVIGGYGYAKHIILFAHRGYRIHTRDLDVSGAAGAFRIEQTDQWTLGTRIEVWLQDQVEEDFCEACRTLAQNFETDVRLTLNGKTLRAKKRRHDYTVDTPLGTLRFSENDTSAVTLWVRIRGPAMFRYHVGHSGHRGFDGTLDLTGEPTEYLTSNRDGLTYRARAQLDELLMRLIGERHQFKTRNQLNLVFNPTDAFDEDPAPECPKPADNAHPFQDMEAELQQRLAQAMAQLTRVNALHTYPENFHIHVADVALRAGRQVDQLSVPRVRRLLGLKRSRKLAWVWTLAVQWVLESETLKTRGAVRYDEETERYQQTTGVLSEFPIDTGFVFDPSVVGLNKRAADHVAVLLNPVEFQDGWLIGDLLDVAIHECAHLLESTHGELFTQVETQIRRDLRRLISETQVLKDARVTMHEVGLR
jgi:hypothetical protein